MDRLTELYSEPVEEFPGSNLIREAVSEVMDIRSVEHVSRDLSSIVGRKVPAGAPAVQISGRLVMNSEQAYDRLALRFKELGFVPLLRYRGGEHVAIAIPGELPRSAGRPWVAALMFGLTLLSVLYVGSGYEWQPGRPFPEFPFLEGWPFAVSLLGILLAHEMGHYILARWSRTPASLPYFIPFPTLLGTMGAVIQTTAPPRNRKTLLLLGAAGPWAGMLLIVPVLMIGLSTSQVDFIRPGTGSFQEGNSLFYLAIKYATFGMVLPSRGMDVFLNSVAFAGWAGLLVTGLNLIPAGQLDGGHIAYALLGRRARYLTWVVVGVLVALSTLWQGWLLWAFLVLLMGRVHSVPLDDVTPLGLRERGIAMLSVLLFIVTFIPIPMTAY